MFRTFEKVNRPAYPSPRQFLSSWTASTEYIYIYIYIYELSEPEFVGRLRQSEQLGSQYQIESLRWPEVV
jgi:hypothetical protein